jgi:hypothetical protein
MAASIDDTSKPDKVWTCNNSMIDVLHAIHPSRGRSVRLTGTILTPRNYRPAAWQHPHRAAASGNPELGTC